MQKRIREVEKIPTCGPHGFTGCGFKLRIGKCAYFEGGSGRGGLEFYKTLCAIYKPAGS